MLNGELYEAGLQIRRMARRYRFPPRVDAEDVAQEAVAILIARGEKPPYSRIQLRRRMIDACRVLLGSGEPHPEVPMALEAMLPAPRRDLAAELDRRTQIDPLSYLRRLFLDQGGWTSAFEDALRIELEASGPRRTRRISYATSRVLAWVRAHPGQPATHTEIGAACGVRRESCCRALGSLVESGQVRAEGSAGRPRAYWPVSLQRAPCYAARRWVRT